MSGVQLSTSKRGFRPPVVLVPRPTRAAPKPADIVPQAASDALGLLVLQFWEDVVLPAARAQSAAQLQEKLDSALDDSLDFFAAVTTFVAQLTSPAKALQVAQRSSDAFGGMLMAALAPLISDDARATVEFALDVASKARDAAQQILASEGAPPDAEADRALARAFHRNNALHNLCAFVLLESGSTRPGAGVVEAAVELLRSTALDAYAAAKQALDARSSQTEDVSPLPFDDEDKALAADWPPTSH